MDLSLLITLGIIFVATLVGSALRASAKDRCLHDLHGYHVTAERLDGRLVWGKLRLFANGAELTYRHDVLDEQRHVETSFVLYKSEYDTLQGLYRYADDLTPENKRRRDLSCRQAFHPRLPRYLWRQVRNFTNTAADSFTEAINLALGRSKAVSSQLVLAQGQTQIKGLTKNILGYVGTNYDDLLESFIGAQVVIEVAYGEARYEYAGVLKDYTAGFVEVLDVFFPQEVALTVQRAERRADLRRGGLHLEQTGPELTLCNDTDYPAVLRMVAWQDGEDELQAVVNPGGRLSYTLPAAAREATLTCRLVRQVDMVLPRAHALIRHRAERYQPADVLRRPMSFVLDDDDDMDYPQLRRSAEDDQAANQVLQTMLLGREPLSSAAQRLAETLAKRQEQEAARTRDTLWEDERL